MTSSLLAGVGCGGLSVSALGGPTQPIFNGSQIAQSFLVGGSGVTLSGVSLYLQNIGFGTGNFTAGSTFLTVAIEADSVTTPGMTPSAHVPSNSPLATASVDASTISNQTPTFYTFTFGSPASLSGTAVYWVVASSSGGTSSQYTGWFSSNISILPNQGVSVGTGATPTWGSINTAITMDVQGGC